jgi:hypothetical protein
MYPDHTDKRSNLSLQADRFAACELIVEAVEKVPRQILGRDAEKSDAIECGTINDLMLGRGQESPKNIVLTRQKDFSYRLIGATNAK